MSVLQHDKIAIVGTGLVGATCAFTLADSGLASELVLVDVNKARAEGEAMDIAHGAAFMPPVQVRSGDYEDCAGAALVILAAGVNQKEGETRLDLMNRNMAIYRQIIPVLEEQCPDAVFLIVANPVDLLTHISAIMLDHLPSGRVIGSGTVLDTSRYRLLLSQHTGIDPRNIHGYILGEHGDSEFAAWTLTSVAGMDLMDFCHQCGACDRHLSDVVRNEIYQDVRDAAYDVISRKGATYYAVALAVRRIAEAILRDEKAVLTVSTHVQGYLDLPDVSLSLPCVVGKGGVERVLPVALSGEEMLLLHASANKLRAALDELNL